MLTFDRLSRLAADSTRELQLEASVAVTPGGVGGAYAEIIVTNRVGHESEPERVLVGIDRNQAPDDIKAVIAAALVARGFGGLPRT